jgi:DNA-binding XRE family transcriptional regulator
MRGIQNPLVNEQQRVDFLQKVSRNLRIARVSAKLDSQCKAAEVVGCSRDRITRAEGGKDIKISDLLEYAIAYGCDIKKFFE